MIIVYEAMKQIEITCYTHSKNSNSDNYFIIIVFLIVKVTLIAVIWSCDQSPSSH